MDRLLLKKFANDIVRHMIVPYLYRDMVAVVEAGNIDILRMRIFDWPADKDLLLKIAIIKGHLHILEWLHDPAMVYTTRALTWAIGNGRLDVLKWLRSKATEDYHSASFAVAALTGQLDILKWFNEQPEFFMHGRAQAMIHAAHNGHLDCMKWLFEQGWLVTGDAMDHAIKNGHIDCAKWLHAKGARCSPGTLNMAGIKGNIDIIKLYSVSEIKLNMNTPLIKQMMPRITYSS